MPVPVLWHSANTLTSITWNWTNVPNETGYSLYEGAHSSPEGPLIQTTPADVTTWTQSPLTENAPKTAHVHASHSGCPAGPTSLAVTAYTSVHNPTTGDFSLANPSGNTVNVTVTAFPNQSLGLSGRQIERSPTGSSGWVVVQSWTSSTAVFSEVVPGGTWYYRIKFRNGDGDETLYSGNNSISITCDVSAPAPPTDLTATGGSASIALSWTAGADSDLAGYRVYRSTTSGSGYALISGSSLVTTTTYTDSTVIAGTRYYYVVTAVDTCGNPSTYSNEANAVASAAGAPPPITDLTVQPLPSANHLRWTKVSGVTGYRVYRKIGAGSWGLHPDLAGPPAKLVNQPISGTVVQFRDSSLTNGTTYQYKVTAVGP